MNKEEVKKIIGNLKVYVDICEFKSNKAKSYISRLEDNIEEVFEGRSYEKMKKRDKFLFEEITSFLQALK